MEYFHWQRNLAGYSPWVAKSWTWPKHVRTQCIILASPDIFTTNNFGHAWLFREEDPSLDVKAQSSPFCKIKDEKKILLQVLCWKSASFFFFTVTQVRDISFLPLDIVISERYLELWLPSGDHKEPLLQKTEDGFVYSLAALPLDLLWLEKMNAFNIWVTLNFTLKPFIDLLIDLFGLALRQWLYRC